VPQRRSRTLSPGSRPIWRPSVVRERSPTPCYSRQVAVRTASPRSEGKHTQRAATRDASKIEDDGTTGGDRTEKRALVDSSEKARVHHRDPGLIPGDFTTTCFRAGDRTRTGDLLGAIRERVGTQRDYGGRLSQFRPGVGGSDSPSVPSSTHHNSPQRKKARQTRLRLHGDTVRASVRRFAPGLFLRNPSARRVPLYLLRLGRLNLAELALPLPGPPSAQSPSSAERPGLHRHGVPVLQLRLQQTVLRRRVS